MAKILKRLPRDVNARAVAIAQAAIEPDSSDILDPRPFETITKTKTRAAKGGKARASTLSHERRRSIAIKAAAARWAKKKRSGRIS